MKLKEIKNRAKLTDIKQAPRLISLVLILVVFSGLLIAQSVLPSARFEAEAGSLSGNASVVSDDVTASAGQFLSFNSAPSPIGQGDFLATFATSSEVNQFVLQSFTGSVSSPNETTVPEFEGGRPAIWKGEHDMACGTPFTLRDVHGTNPSEFFWHCAPAGPDSGHFMTSLMTSGYGQADFAPNRTFRQVKEVCWDQSMVSLPRKWTQVIIVPETMYQSHTWPAGTRYGGQPRLNYVNPELLPAPATFGISPGPIPTGQHGPEWPGRDAFNASWAPQWDAYLLTFTIGSIQQYSKQGAEYYFHAIDTTDPRPRFKQCIVDGEDGYVYHYNDMPTTQWTGGRRSVIRLPGSIPNGDVRVIFQDDTYDTFKADNPDPTGMDGRQPETTWHWDNIHIDEGPNWTLDAVPRPAEGNWSLPF